MSARGLLRDLLQGYAQENEDEPFNPREWGMIESILEQHEIDWQEELDSDRKWWGEDVVKMLTQLRYYEPQETQ